MSASGAGFYDGAQIMGWFVFLAWSAYATVAAIGGLSTALRFVLALCWFFIAAWTAIGLFEAFADFTYALPLLGVGAAVMAFILRGSYPPLPRAVQIAAVILFSTGVLAGEVLEPVIARIPGPNAWPPSFLFFVYAWVCLLSAESIKRVSLAKKIAFIVSWLFIAPSLLRPLPGMEQLGELGVFILALALPAPVELRDGTVFLRRLAIASALLLFAVSALQALPPSSGSEVARLQARTVSDVFAVTAAGGLAAFAGVWLNHRALTIGSGLILLPVASLIYLMGLYFPVLSKVSMTTNLLPLVIVILITGIEMPRGQGLLWSPSGWRRAEIRPVSD